MNAGIYCIENISNKKIYIGQSKNIDKRLLQHKNLLEIGKHYNIHLQNSYNKYGKQYFSFRILEKTDDLKPLNKLEQKWICHYESFAGKNGYNIKYPTEVFRQSFKEIEWRKCKVCGTEYGLMMGNYWDYERFLYQNLCSKKCHKKRWGILYEKPPKKVSQSKIISLCDYCGETIKNPHKRKFCDYCLLVHHYNWSEKAAKQQLGIK